jgi:hypothetical protein
MLRVDESGATGAYKNLSLLSPLYDGSGDQETGEAKDRAGDVGQRIADVGCATNRFLQQLIECGIDCGDENHGDKESHADSSCVVKPPRQQKPEAEVHQQMCHLVGVSGQAGGDDGDVRQREDEAPIPEKRSGDPAADSRSGG